jgi:aminoglycoside 2'-N-acetyltransferase I
MLSDQADQFNIQAVPGKLISETLKKEITSLCNRAYEEDMEPLLETFVDATHILGYFDGGLVSHALWVTRYLQAGTEPIMRTAYVEAVATDSNYRRRGFAASVMRYLIGKIQDYDLAALSPFNVEYYGRLGWELWQGPLFVRTNDTLLPSPDDEEVMIFRLPKTPTLDLKASLSAEWREGELW